eukprot:gene16604-biopygen5914
MALMRQATELKRRCCTDNANGVWMGNVTPMPFLFARRSGGHQRRQIARQAAICRREAATGRQPRPPGRPGRQRPPVGPPVEPSAGAEAHATLGSPSARATSKVWSATAICSPSFSLQPAQLAAKLAAKTPPAAKMTASSHLSDLLRRNAHGGLIKDTDEPASARHLLPEGWREQTRDGFLANDSQWDNGVAAWRQSGGKKNLAEVDQEGKQADNEQPREFMPTDRFRRVPSVIRNTPQAKANAVFETPHDDPS